jgi:EAL domain-containing protein (putative c-di-GMP-specific phosphodiesterase class I)
MGDFHVTADTKGRVLIVDDEPDLVEVYAAVLREQGYTVTTAGTGREAMNLLGGSTFDVVLSDIVMPEMGGIELLREIRKRDLEVPVLMITGSPTVETAAQAVDYGALKYLVKPVPEKDLVARVDEAIRLHLVAKLKREALEHVTGEARLADRAGLEAHFGRALQCLWMAYQPILRASDGSLYAQEALVRSTDLALRTPGALFDAAERLGRLHDLGRVIRACVGREVAAQAANGYLFVNLHSQDLADAALYEQGDALWRNAKTIVYEITERASLEGVTEVRSRIARLKDAGFRIAIDDLGAGYAGLTSFTALEPSVVKLDMALVRGVDKEPLKQRLIGSLTTLCKDLGILVVAEGVETEGEREAVKTLGCDLLQGFLLGKPAPAAQATPRVR